MENKIKKWIFIGGAPRSGTSLLQAIFNQHSECVSPPEAHLLPNYAYAPTSKITKALYDFSSLNKILSTDEKVQRLNISANEVLSSLRPGLNAVELFIRYMNIYAEKYNKTILVEGAPQNVWLSGEIRKQFQGAYILHILRDPRDVFMSTMKAEFTRKFNLNTMIIANHYLLQYESGMDMASKMYGKKYLRIFYEDLITNPEQEIKKICDTVEINFEPSMLEFYKSSDKVAASGESWKENLNKNFMSNNFGKWKTGMKEEDIIMVEKICKRVFEDFPAKYQRSDLWKNKSTFFIQKALMPLHKRKAKDFIKNKLSVVKKDKTPEEIDALATVERLDYFGVFDSFKKK